MKNKLVTSAFLLMTAVFIVILLLPADMESIEAENRTISTLPPLNEETYLSGEFAAGTESAIDDSVGLRSSLTRLSKQIDAQKGITPETGSVISTNKDIGTGTVQKMTLLLVGNTVMEMFTKKPDTEKLYTDAINYYASKLPENVMLFSMLIPTQLEFREPIYKNLQDSQSEAISDMYSMLDERVITVDACSALEAHADEYLYFRTDHHWTPLGAYYAYCEFMKEEGGKAVKRTDFEKNNIQNVLGYLYDRVEDPAIAETPDTIEWYDVDPDEKIKVSMHNVNKDGTLGDYTGVMYDRTKADYLFFFGSDHPVVEMTNTDIEDGKTIVVLKDSYANVFAPWLIKSYGKVILVDPRIYKGNFETILDTYSPDEVLILNYVFTTSFADYCGVLKGIYTDPQ